MVETKTQIKRLIWLYFVFLIFEGALRKWFLPSLANPILIIRDPVVLCIYILAIQGRIFPRNRFIWFGALLAFLCLSLTTFATETPIAVALYGLRTNFLHLPLIFIMAKVFDLEDVRAIGQWALIFSVPMALLMIVQFRSDPTAWIVAGADQSFKQIDSAMGRIRPPGTFSFILGPVYFFSMVAAFVLQSQFARRPYSLPLLLSAVFALVTAAAVSGSRSLLGSMAVVLICGFFATAILRPQFLFRWGQAIIVGAIVIYGASQIDIFNEGVEVFSTRIENASGTEGGAQGFVARFISAFIPSSDLWLTAPLEGYGLGVGTNVGSALLTGKAQFLLAEDEWARIVLEIGPILGAAFIFYRVCIALWLGLHSIQQAKRGNPLPLLLFGACGLLLLIGNWGQSTALGFTAFVSGLCLSSMRAHPAHNETQTFYAPGHKGHLQKTKFTKSNVDRGTSHQAPGGKVLP